MGLICIILLGCRGGLFICKQYLILTAEEMPDVKEGRRTSQTKQEFDNSPRKSQQPTLQKTEENQ